LTVTQWLIAVFCYGGQTVSPANTHSGKHQGGQTVFVSANIPAS